ncbi:MAG TPA: hypothetical protein VM347_38445, partial [Nonomuraea sp.]|nr:hypothetical protein [Nonomuraea sp.]
SGVHDLYVVFENVGITLGRLELTGTGRTAPRSAGAVRADRGRVGRGRMGRGRAGTGRAAT